MDRAFWKFAPLEGSLPKPLALAYHGHQFQVYNPQIGDGRGFLFAQMRDDGRAGCLILAPRDRDRRRGRGTGDGRLTLKGGVREMLAAGMLEALGVYTSKAFSLIETGEQLARNDEPSPTRSSVLVRCRTAICGSAHSSGRPTRATPTRSASWSSIASVTITQPLRVRTWRRRRRGFARDCGGDGGACGVLDVCWVRPWRAQHRQHGGDGRELRLRAVALPAVLGPELHGGLFRRAGALCVRTPAFGCAVEPVSQLASCLTLVADVPALEPELQRFEELYRAAFRRRMLAVLGLKSIGEEQDLPSSKRCSRGWVRRGRRGRRCSSTGSGDRARCGARAGPLAQAVCTPGFAPVRRALMSISQNDPERLDHAYFKEEAPVSS
jgi:hypothetical protein